MSEKSEEDLVGDVDFDFDLHDEIPSATTSPNVRKEDSFLMKKSIGDRMSKANPPSVNVKRPVKRKAPTKPTKEDDLLQAFAVGEASSKTAPSQTSVKKRKSEPELSKKAIHGQQPSVKKDTSKENEKNEVQKTSASSTDFLASSTVKGHQDSGVKKIESEEKAINAENGGKTFASNDRIKEVKIKEVIEERKESTKKTTTTKGEQEESMKKMIAAKGEQDERTKKTTAKAEQEERTKKATTTKGEHENEEERTKEMTIAKREQEERTKITMENWSGSSKTRIQETKEIPKEKSSNTTSNSSNKTTKSPAAMDKKENTHSVVLKSNESNVSKRDKEETRKNVEEYRFTEDDYKDIDVYLAGQMFDRIRNKAVASNQAVRYTVKVSPLEMSDLAQPSFQQIIQLHPTLTLFFKHQVVKFRKKKGFAEAIFYTMTELKEFVYQLTQLKLTEKKIDVQITALRPNQKPDVLSFVLHLNRNGKLMTLINSGEDPMINKPAPAGLLMPKVQFERVPSTSNGAFMHSMFPFTNNVVITRSRVGKETDQVYHGPLSVFFINEKWLEAVAECCTDFTANDTPLTIVGDSNPGSREKDSESNLEKKRSGTTSDGKQSDVHQSISAVDKAGDDDDDAVANMTRDVCADMLESIKKLKELECDNPNMKRILQMQAQLNDLQKSLIKPAKTTKSDGSKEANVEMDIESVNQKNCKLTPGEKTRKEMDNLQEMLEEADQVERQREERVKQERDSESKKRREHELKRKSQWARKIISDYKQENVKGEISEGAEKILKQREQRLREREEEEKRKIEREEKERLRRLREKDEAERKEEERKRLIKKIEEARLKDSQKAEKKLSSAASTSAVMIDDGIDARLATFERELAQQGKIDRVTSSPPRADQPYIPEEETDELEDCTIVMEKDYQDLWVQHQLHTLPVNYRVRLSSMVNRYCPVQSCPAKVYFRDGAAYQEHWSIFHEPHTTMRFCQKCSAYFMSYEELEKHMMKHHHLTLLEGKHLARNSRVKVVPNPSFRDPLPFLPPLLSP